MDLNINILGLVAVKRDEDTPLTRLKLRAVKPSNIGGNYYLTFPSSLKIWQSENRTGEVTEATEFDANQETTLYVEALNKSSQLNDQQIVLNWKEGEEKNISYGDWVNLTAVQAEFPITIRAFIPYLWTEPDFPATFWDLVGLGFYDVIAHGDNRQLKLDENASIRVKQYITLTPYEELHTEGDISIQRNIVTVDQSKHYRKETSVPAEDQDKPHGYSLVPNAKVIASGEPKITNEKYELKSRGNHQMNFHAESGAKDGAFSDIILPLVPALDWKLDFTVDCTNPIKPKIKVTGVRDGFPGYEVFAKGITDDWQELYYWVPPWERQVGPYWLNIDEEVSAEILIQ